MSAPRSRESLGEWSPVPIYSRRLPSRPRLKAADGRRSVERIGLGLSATVPWAADRLGVCGRLPATAIARHHVSQVGHRRTTPQTRQSSSFALRRRLNPLEFILVAFVGDNQHLHSETLEIRPTGDVETGSWLQVEFPFVGVAPAGVNLISPHYMIRAERVEKVSEDWYRSNLCLACYGLLGPDPTTC